MSRKNTVVVVRDRLVETLTEIQTNSRRETPAIVDELVPFAHLPGFDSINGVEAAVILSDKLGVEIEEIGFVAPSDGRRMTIKEIVNSLVAKYGAQIAFHQERDGSSSDGQSSPQTRS